MEEFHIYPESNFNAPLNYLPNLKRLCISGLLRTKNEWTEMQFPKCLEVLDASGSNFDVTTIEDFPNVTDLDLRGCDSEIKL